jgi:hypothetical protein
LEAAWSTHFSKDIEHRFVANASLTLPDFLTLEVRVSARARQKGGVINGTLDETALTITSGTLLLCFACADLERIDCGQTTLAAHISANSAQGPKHRVGKQRAPVLHKHRVAQHDQKITGLRSDAHTYLFTAAVKAASSGALACSFCLMPDATNKRQMQEISAPEKSAL